MNDLSARIARLLAIHEARQVRRAEEERLSAIGYEKGQRLLDELFERLKVLDGIDVNDLLVDVQRKCMSVEVTTDDRLIHRYDAYQELDGACLVCGVTPVTVEEAVAHTVEWLEKNIGE